MKLMKEIKIYNLEFPEGVRSLNICGYIFDAVSNYDEVYKLMPNYNVTKITGSHQITAIVKKLNPATGETLQENPDFIRNGDAAIIKVKPITPLVIEKQKEIPEMSRFAVRDSGTTVAAGMCIDLVKK